MGFGDFTLGEVICELAKLAAVIVLLVVVAVIMWGLS
jgi:hypothetical protein